jgi:hypothetical protein
MYTIVIGVIVGIICIKLAGQGGTKEWLSYEHLEEEPTQ